jgi:CubicO group peptidase (beta-lactamase class C family)
MPTVRVPLLALSAPALLVLPLRGQEPLRLDAVATVVADLEGYVPGRLAEDRIPGMAIALIRDGRVAWEGAFGVTNSITARPARAETAFPAASLGKVVVAHAALRLVDREVLGLDTPLDRYLQTPWLSDSADRARITLRQVLTHTSGLSNFLGDRKRLSRFTPGERFGYSGVGFMYLQEVLESVGKAPLDSVVARETLRPMGLERVWFGRGPADPGSVAWGHIPLGRAVAPFGIVFLPLSLVVLAASSLLSRIRRQWWRLSRREAWAGTAGAAAGATAFLFSKAANPWLVPFFVLGFAACVGLAVALANLLPRKIPRTLTAAALFAALYLAGRRFPVPVPAIPRDPNAASSLHATAGELARFLVAAANDSAAMREPRVPASEHLSWGYGVGVQRWVSGNAIFHWGSNPAVQAAMIYYPDAGAGVVVLANGGTAGDAVGEVALRAVGGPTYWIEE